MRRDPHAEERLPWIVWTVAYAMLLGATVAAEGVSLWAMRFWVYPAICLALTAMVARDAHTAEPTALPVAHAHRKS